MLTINNPKDEYNHDIIKNILENFKLKYWCMADEKGLKEEVYHTHLYFVSCTSAISFNKIKKLFPTAHIEPAHQSSIDCKHYIAKTGKWADDEKADTSIDGTFEEWGEIPDERKGKRTDWEIAREMIENGNDILTIIEILPHLTKNMNTLETLRQKILNDEFSKIFRELEVTYIYGKTELGKTRYVMDKYKYENVCKLTNYKHGCFDKYNCEDVLLLDEFDSSFNIQDMNNYLDGYPMHLPCRYTNKVSCYTKVYIVSNIPLECQYSYIRITQPLVWEAFIRRINKVIIFTGTNKYKEYDTKDYINQITFNDEF